MIGIALVVMTMHEILSMSWTILEFAMVQGPLICLVVFLLIMVKTLLDLSKRLAKLAAPGIRKLHPSSRKK